MFNIDTTERSVTTDGVATRTTFAVQFVLEVETRSFAETIRDQLPAMETPTVSPGAYRSYVDSAGLARPAVGASVPFYDRQPAEGLYDMIPRLEGFDRLVRSGTLAIRKYDFESPCEEPTVVAATHFY